MEQEPVKGGHRARSRGGSGRPLVRGLRHQHDVSRARPSCSQHAVSEEFFHMQTRQRSKPKEVPSCFFVMFVCFPNGACVAVFLALILLHFPFPLLQSHAFWACLSPPYSDLRVSRDGNPDRVHKCEYVGPHAVTLLYDMIPRWSVVGSRAGLLVLVRECWVSCGTVVLVRDCCSREGLF